MKHNTFRFALRTTAAALLLAAAASCSDGGDVAGLSEGGGDKDSGGDGRRTVTVHFASGDGDGEAAAAEGRGDGVPATRTTLDGNKVLWETTDAIRIFAVKGDGTVAEGGDGKHYHPATSGTASADFVPDSEGDKITLDEGTYDFRSYYYTRGITASMADKVQCSLTDMTQEDGTASGHIADGDLMWAEPVTNVGVSAGDTEPTVTFTYRHAFPMLVFTVTDAGTRTVKAISVRTADGTGAVKGTVLVSLTDGKVELYGGNGTSYSTLTFTTAMGADGTGRLLILPQAAGTELIAGVLTTDGVVYEYTKEVPAAGLEGGKSYAFEFSLADGDVAGRTVCKAEAEAGDAGKLNWKIGDEAGLRTFALAVKYYKRNSDNAVLTADIPLEGGQWEPIGGSGATAYSGTFDGQGHTVSGLSVATAGDYAGFFGNLNGAKVTGLGVEGNVTATGRYAGGIAGRTNTGSSITDCYFTGSVTATGGYAGGIAGFNSGSTITGCFTSGGTVSATDRYAGGIAGNNYYNASITACYSSASVTTTGDYAGGIAGYNTSNASVTSCYATGTVSAANSGGGIAGYNNSSTLSGCIALGKEVVRTGTGNDFGRVAGFDNGTITGCASYEGMRLPTGNMAGQNGTLLTAAECIAADTYAGWTTDGGWTTDAAGTWTYLPWRTALYTIFHSNNALCIPVPEHIATAAQ